MNNPEKVVHAKKSRERVFTDLYLLFTSNHWKWEWSKKKPSLFLSGTREKTEKMASTRRKRKFCIWNARAPYARVCGVPYERDGTAGDW